MKCIYMILMYQSLNEKPREYTFDEAKELVKKALSVLGDKYINDLNNYKLLT